MRLQKFTSARLLSFVFFGLLRNTSNPLLVPQQALLHSPGVKALGIVIGTIPNPKKPNRMKPSTMNCQKVHHSGTFFFFPLLEELPELLFFLAGQKIASQLKSTSKTYRFRRCQNMGERQGERRLPTSSEKLIAADLFLCFFFSFFFCFSDLSLSTVLHTRKTLLCEW